MGDTAAQTFSNRTSLFILFGAGALCLWPEISGAMALSVGVLIGLVGANAHTVSTKPLATRLLQISVVGLGAGMNLNVIWAVGITGIGYTIAGISFTFALGLWLGRRAGLPRDLAILLTSGTAICGGSAIAAVAGVLKAKQEETTVALATVFTLNAIALILFPVLGHVINLNGHEFGLWAALAIHDTSSVIGAGAAYGKEALEVAATVKLARALWIAPMALAIGWIVTRGEKDNQNGGKIAIPWFILGFIATAAVVSFVPAVVDYGQMVAAGAKRTLVLTLFLIGANLSKSALKAVGWRPLAVGVILWICVSVATISAILGGWIR